MRESGVLLPDSWAKKREATILLAHARAAFERDPFRCSAGMPFADRSAFSRQRIAAFIAARFVASGLAEVEAHAALPATPLCCASVGRSSFGEIGPPLPTVFAPPTWSTVTAGPRMPFVGSAET